MLPAAPVTVMLTGAFAIEDSFETCVVAGRRRQPGRTTL